MNEKPLERLHFFNGQRLQAEDFRLEQDYHMRVRRWLNRSLYTSGIASGLEVRKIPGKSSVVVGPGLALDCFGREIILLDEQPVSLHGRGIHYLTIRYQEDSTARQDACCPPATGSKNHTASGGPSRILAEPVLEWSTALPHEESGKVLLARVELAPGCGEVKVLDTSVRHYVGAASAAKVRQYVLEGVRELDQNNPASIVFHVRGRNPTSITLYLRSEPFPTYFYTEMGRHTHGSNVEQGASTGPASAIDQHVHSGSTLNATNQFHGHSAWGFASKSPYAGTIPPTKPEDIFDAATSALLPYPDGPKSINFPGFGDPNYDTNTPPMMLRMITTIGTNGPGGETVPHSEHLGSLVGMEIHDDLGHGHPIDGSTGDPQTTLAPSNFHHHAFSASISRFGVDVDARSGAHLKYVSNLQISIGPMGHAIPKTADILRQLSDSNPTDWRGKIRLGEGGSTQGTVDVLQENGTGAIRLDFLPDISFGEGEYVIELSVPAGTNTQPNGGRIHYNLYIESP
jgi:hypothetical protein